MQRASDPGRAKAELGGPQYKAKVHNIANPSVQLSIIVFNYRISGQEK